MAQISLGLLIRLMFHSNRGTGSKRWVISLISEGRGFLHGYFQLLLQLNEGLTTLELARLVCMEMQKMRFQKQQHLGQIARVRCFLILFAWLTVWQDTLHVYIANRSTTPVRGGFKRSLYCLTVFKLGRGRGGVPMGAHYICCKHIFLLA